MRNITVRLLAIMPEYVQHAIASPDVLIVHFSVGLYGQSKIFRMTAIFSLESDYFPFADEEKNLNVQEVADILGQTFLDAGEDSIWTMIKNIRGYKPSPVEPWMPLDIRLDDFYAAGWQTMDVGVSWRNPRL